MSGVDQAEGMLVNKIKKSRILILIFFEHFKGTVIVELCPNI